MAPMASKIPTFAYARSQLPEPLGKKRTRPPPPPNTTRTSPNPKQRKTQHVPALDAPRTQKRAPSPIASTSPRKRARPDVNANTSPLQPLTRAQARVLEGDPIDLLSVPDEPPREKSRSVSGLGFSPEGSQLLGQEGPDISSGGLYSDIEDEGEEEEETRVGKRTTRPSPTKDITPRRQSTSTTRRQSSATKSRTTPRGQPSTSRRQSTTPTPQRRTQPKTLPPPQIIPTAAQARKEAAAKAEAAKASKETRAGASQPESQMSAQARREARLAAAQAEAEAKLRASLESDDGDMGVAELSLIGEEEPEEEELQEEELQEEEADEAEREEEVDEEEVGNETTRTLQADGEDEDDPLATAPVLDTPRSSRRSPTTTPRPTQPTPRITRSSRKTTPTRSTRKTTPSRSTRKTTPTRSASRTTATKTTTPLTRRRTLNKSQSHVRWTPRSSSSRKRRSTMPEESESEYDEFGEYESPGGSRVVGGGDGGGLRRSLRRRSDGSANRSGEDDRAEEGDGSIAASVRARKRSSGRLEGWSSVVEEGVEEDAEEEEGDETVGQVGERSRDENESAWEDQDRSTRSRRDETDRSVVSRRNTSMAGSQTKGNTTQSRAESPPSGPLLGHSISPFPEELASPPPVLMLPLQDVEDGGEGGQDEDGDEDGGSEPGMTPSPPARPSFGRDRSTLGRDRSMPSQNRLSLGQIRRTSGQTHHTPGQAADQTRSAFPQISPARTQLNPHGSKSPVRVEVVIPVRRKSWLHKAQVDTSRMSQVGNTTRATQPGNRTQTTLARDMTSKTQPRTSTINRTLQQPTPDLSSLERSRSTESEVLSDKSGNELSPIESSLDPSSYHPSTDTVDRDGHELVDDVHMFADGRLRDSSGRYVPQDILVQAGGAQEEEREAGQEDQEEHEIRGDQGDQDVPIQDEVEEVSIQEQGTETTSVHSIRAEDAENSLNRTGNWTFTSEKIALSVQAAGQLASGLANIFSFQSTLLDSGADTTQNGRKSVGSKSTMQRDSSISLGEWRPNYARRPRGPGKKSLLARAEAAGQNGDVQRDSSISLGAWQPNYSRRGSNSELNKTPAGNTSRQSIGEGARADENSIGENTARTEPVGAPERIPPRFGPELSRFSHTPRVGFESTPRAGYDFTPGSDFGSIPDSALGSISRSTFRSGPRPKFGPAQSTPFVRGERPSLSLGSFANLNLDAEQGGRIPYHLKGKARAVDGREEGEVPDLMGLKSGLGSRQRSPREDQSVAAEQSVPSSPISPIPNSHLDHEVSVDGSVAVEANSPNQSLRTERAPTPQTTRVRTSESEEEDDEDDDAPPSPSAGRQSFNEQTFQGIKGRNLSDILQLRKQARDRSGPGDEPWSNSMEFPGTTTRLDAQAQEVLQSPSSHSGVLSMSPLEAHRPGTSETSADFGEHGTTKKPAAPTHSTPHYQDDTISLEDHELEPQPPSANNSRFNRSLSSRQTCTPHSKSLGVMQEFNASVRFDGPSRARIRRSGTPPPTIRGRRTLSGEPHSGDEDSNGEAEEHWQDEDSREMRSGNTSAPSSEIENDGENEVEGLEYEDNEEDEDEDEGEDDELDYDEDGQPIIKVSGPAPVVAQAKSALLQAGYVEDTRSMEKYVQRSQSRSVRSRSRSRAGDESSMRQVSMSNTSYGHFLGDRTSGLSRSQMMAEASRYEDWEPPSRRELLPRKWTEHDWRMLAHYLRRVQKSQALARGLPSREDLDVMLVNVHAVVDRFVEEEAHGIKLEGEWDRTEIAGRAAYLIIREKEKNSSWRETLFDSASFPAIIADMTRPRAAEEEIDAHVDDLPTRQMLPAALAEVPGPSRQRVTSGQRRVEPQNTSISSTHNPPARVAQETWVEQTQDSSNLAQNQTTDSAQGDTLDPARRKAKVAAARQRARQLREARKLAELPPSDLSRSQDSQLVATQTDATSSTSFAKVVGSITSFFGNRPPPHVGLLAEPGVSFPKLKPVSRNPVDLTEADDEEELSRFPVLNHVPTPIRPTPARPRRQKRVEPRLDLPTLQHVSLPPEEPAPKRKTIKRVRSVKEIARNFEVLEEENRKAAEVARARIGYGRGPSGSDSVPAGSRRIVSGEASSGKPTAPTKGARPAASTKPRKKIVERVPKHEVEVIEISDSEVGEFADL
ncbi:hypothetical protein BDV93DRAFT_605167 [Ceratobasidium sp. AG-I]|nr:hypothetical protein BDV93DRAFT_605167 [Ceratobasidium sp. AG-I]